MTSYELAVIDERIHRATLRLAEQTGAWIGILSALPFYFFRNEWWGWVAAIATTMVAYWVFVEPFRTKLEEAEARVSRLEPPPTDSLY